MFRPPQLLLLACFVAGVSGPMYGQETAVPPVPAWQDNASVYLRTDRLAETYTAEHTTHRPSAEHRLAGDAVSAAAYDTPVATAAAQPSSDVEPDRRHLAPPSTQSEALTTEQARFDDASRRLPRFGLPLDSMYSMLTALALVVGLFLLCAWALRRGTRKSTTLLPGEVVSVLGRVPLAARQFAQLLRVGNKLVLVSVTPAGAETLAEVTDPAEVDRLLGICQQHDPRSTTREFEQVFRQLAQERAPDGFLERDARSDHDVHQVYRGGPVRG